MDRLGRIFGTHDEAETEDFDSVEAETPPTPVGQDERRMQVRAYNHWAGQLGDRNYPAIDGLHPQSLEDFGPYSVLLDFTKGVDDPTIRYLGSELAAECGAPVTIASLSEVPGRSLLSRITDHYMQILANEAPIGFEAEFINQRGLTALYRGILLPYSSDDATIDYIYGVINWKETADAATADALLAEIDKALGSPAATPEPLAEDEDMDNLLDLSQFAEADPVRDLGIEPHDAPEHSALTIPAPSFGQPANDEADRAADDEYGTDYFAAEDDGLGTGSEWGQGFSGFGEDDPVYAVDYGSNPLEDETEGEDVEDVVDPLADQSVGLGLSSLVNRTARTKVTVSLTGPASTGTDARIATDAADAAEFGAHELSGEPEPVAYDGGATAQDLAFLASQTAPFAEDCEDDEDVAIDFGLGDFGGDAFGQDDAADVAEFGAHELSGEPEPVAFDGGATAQDLAFLASQTTPFAEDCEDDEDVAIDFGLGDFGGDAFGDEEGAEQDGLYDCLAAAREMAQLARSSEDRSRKALYQAVGRAYDFSLEAAANPEDFDELIAENGLSVQDRAPMTPVVKLVFGADYDKTRLTEYAAVLDYAHRTGVERGALGQLLREAEGGLKGIVQAERRARKEASGKPVDPFDGIREALAKKLRKLGPIELDDLAADGPEFGLVMIRRQADGSVALIGEVPRDTALVERAGRRLVA